MHRLVDQMTENPFLRLRESLQYMLDCEGDGWQLVHHVVAMGLQKMDANGVITSTTWMVVPAEQPDYVTDGLVQAAEDMRASCDIEDD